MTREWQVLISTRLTVEETVTVFTEDDEDEFRAADAAYDYAFDELGWEDVEINGEPEEIK